MRVLLICPWRSACHVEEELNGNRVVQHVICWQAMKAKNLLKENPRNNGRFGLCEARVSPRVRRLTATI